MRLSVEVSGEEFLATLDSSLSGPTATSNVSEPHDTQTALSPEFRPPSVATSNVHDSHTYMSAIPSSTLDGAPCVMGIDEAGRGPVLGPMVYGVAYCREDYSTTELGKIGFNDSKVLSHAVRSHFLRRLCDPQTGLSEEIGWAVTVMTARDIGSKMLRPVSHGLENLNEQAHQSTMDLIHRVLENKVNLTHVYVDTVGPPQAYETKLSRRFPQINFTVTKKADSLYAIVGAASICAKVTRDASLLEHLRTSGNADWGSGYPSDPKTSAWLRNSMDKVFGWGPVVRFSWQTTRDALRNNSAVEVLW